MRALGILGGIIVMASGANAAENDMALPFGPFTDHLNIVFSVQDAENVTEFYGDVLGLERIDNIDFPGDAYMIRYMGGKSEIKFIVTGAELPHRAGSVASARGVRLLAFLLPAEKKNGILERMKAAGLDVPDLNSGESADGYGYEYWITADLEGNAIELVFLDDRAPASKYDQVQIGLAVSDLKAAEKFLLDVMGYSDDGTNEIANGAILRRFGLGVSQVKCWEVPDNRPAYVAGPMEMTGMCLVQAIVTDVEKVRADVIERGGTIAQEPFPLGKLATIMFVEGPDGILFEIVGPLLDRFK